MTLGRWAGRLLLGLVLLGFPACGSQEEPRPLPPPAPATMPCGREAETGPAGPDGIVPLGAFVSPTDKLMDLWLFGSRVAYVSDLMRSVVVCDLRTGEAQVLATVDGSERWVRPVRGDGDTVIWVEYMKGGNPYGPQPWKIRAHDLSTGRTWLVAASPEDDNSTLHEPTIDGSTIVWAAFPGGGTTGENVNIYAYDIRTRTTRVLTTGAFPTIADGQVYFTDRDADLHVLPVDGSAPPRQLTHGARIAGFVSARHGLVTWTPQRDRPPEETDDGVRPIFVLQPGSTTPRVVADGYEFQGPQAGDRFVIGYSTERPEGFFVVASDGTDLRPFTVTTDWENDSSAGLSVDGDRVAWVTVDDRLGKRKPAYLRIGRVER